MAEVAGVDEFGLLHEKGLDHIITDLKLYFRIFHGPDLDLGDGSLDLQMIEAVAPEIRLIWAALAGTFLQSFISTADGDGLDKAVELLDIQRRSATKATGTVTFSRATAAPAGGTTIPAGTVVGTEADVLFTTNAAVTIPEGQTSVDAAVTASLAGTGGNVSSGTVTGLITAVTGVDTVTNAAGMTGGTAQETDTSLRTRALNSPAVRGKGTVNAIKSGLETIDNVRKVVVLVNAADDTSADDRFVDSTATGTAGETANVASDEKLAWLFSVAAGGEWVQDVEFTVSHISGTPALTVRIENVATGDANGTLASSHLSKTGVAPGDETVTSVHFERPAFLAEGTYALVLIPTAGAVAFDGAVNTPANKARKYDGAAWAADANIDNPKAAIIGGIPPHAVHPFVDGGTNQEIGDKLLDYVAAGIRTWGNVTVTSGGYEFRFSRPDFLTIYVAVTIETNSEWDATNGPNAVRDAIVEYIGGTDTKGNIHPGLGLGAKVVRVKVSDAISDVPGVADITQLLIDTVDPPVSSSGNVAVASTKTARAETAANIGVTVA